MLKNILISLRMLIVMILLVGLLYPLFITGISQLFFKEKANGSLIKKDGKIIGSELIGQKFTSDKYFWRRPSASDYGTMPSGASNLSYTSADLKKMLKIEKNFLAEAKTFQRIYYFLLLVELTLILPLLQPGFS